MAIEVFPIPSSGEASALPTSLTLPLSNVLYEYTYAFDPNVYTFVSNGNNIYLEYYSGNTFLSSITVTSSPTDFTIPNGVTKIRLWTTAGTNTLFTFTIKSIFASLTDTLFTGGTIDTITSTGTYTGTSTSGYAWIMVVGGGGGSGGVAQTGRSGGGGAGGVAIAYVQLTGSVPVTIGTNGTGGAAGNRPSVQSTSGTAGGTTTWGTGDTAVSATGGGGSDFVQTAHTNGAGGTNGTVTNSYNGVNLTPTSTAAAGENGKDGSELYDWAINVGITGTGGGGGVYTQGGGRVGDFGRGGRGSDGSSTPTYGRGLDATGYGAGGGGSYNTGAGAAGSPGVIFVRKL
jgi:hypothetical protein